MTQTIRAFEWWEFKIGPLLASIYATAYLLKLSVLPLWSLILLALVALIPGAAYVSVVNDVTDLQDDIASGKSNRLAGKSRTTMALLLAACIAPGVVVAWVWRGDSLLLALYLAAWTSFSLYSLPPFRFKNRGLLGVLADACGAHLFPTLLVVALVFRHHSLPIDPVWFGAVAAWSLCYGLRGILWHQLSDLDNDAKIGLHTFAQRHEAGFIQRLGHYVVFPIELSAFAVMLWHSGSRLALVFVGAYALLEWLRWKRWQMSLMIVTPKENSYIVMQEFYEVFYPLCFLLSSCLRHPWDALVIVAHLLLFPGRASQSRRDAVSLANDEFKSMKDWLRPLKNRLRPLLRRTKSR